MTINRISTDAAAADLLGFAPVPRKCQRHDGWTPARQRAFIAALADTGCVSRAARLVNMAAEGAYMLRRQPGAEAFRRAWEAALDFGVQRLKDIAFERAIEGQLVPVFVAGKLLGYRRKRNDRLLMFCLRHYGQDADGRRVTVNYFSARAGAAAGTGEGGAQAVAEASATTVRTTVSGGGAADRQARLSADDARANLIAGFAPADLDAQAQAEIRAALAACAERRRTAEPDDDLELAYVPEHKVPLHTGELDPGPDADFEEWIPFAEGEGPWEALEPPAPLEATAPPALEGFTAEVVGEGAPAISSQGEPALSAVEGHAKRASPPISSPFQGEDRLALRRERAERGALSTAPTPPALLLPGDLPACPAERARIAALHAEADARELAEFYREEVHIPAHLKRPPKPRRKPKPA